MDEGELDKSEQATPFKLKQARQKGAIARGMDLGFLASLIALLAYAWISGPAAAVGMSRAIATHLAVSADIVGSPSALLAQTGALFSSVIRPMILFGATVFAVVFLFEFLQVGPVFSGQPLKPDFSRINPAKGLKRLFSFRLLVEAFKSVIKLGIYGTVGWLVIAAVLKEDSASLISADRLMAMMATNGFRLLMFCALAAAAIAAIDQFFSRRDFAKRMRMSRRELKREHRDREGDQRLKNKRKEFHNEFIKMAKSLRNARGSDVILTNPTHYAVALRYDPDTMGAPQIVSRGAGKMAERIRRIATIYGVLVVQESALARALYKTRLLEQEVPEAQYQAVADIYRRHRLVGRGQ